MPTNLDLTHVIRGNVIAALKADSALTGIVTAARIYPQAQPATPTFPFVRIGAPISTPQFIDGGDGTNYSAAIHSFTKRTSATPDPEVQAMAINAEVVRILNAIEDVSIGDGLTLDVYPRQAQIMQDGDADSFHGFVLFDANAS